MGGRRGRRKGGKVGERGKERNGNGPTKFWRKIDALVGQVSYEVTELW